MAHNTMTKRIVTGKTSIPSHGPQNRYQPKKGKGMLDNSMIITRGRDAKQHRIDFNKWWGEPVIKGEEHE